MTTDKKQTPASETAGPAAPAAAPAPPPAAGGEDVALFKNEIEIMCRKRLSQLDRGPVKAYAAQSLRGGVPLFALVCEPVLVPRQRTVQKFAAIINPGLVRLVGAGVVYWPPARAQRYVFIYENNMGQPLAEKKQGGLGWKPERVIQSVVKPMISVLLDMRDKDMIHGNISPFNMFVGGAAGNERVMLGECLATPIGLLQPALFETVERAMCDPLAKGHGSIDDDLYAFGVTLCYLMRTRDPMEGMTDDEIIREKMEIGSYAALTGKDRFTGGILELLRGLLYDDREQRWTLDEIEAWDAGQRLSPKQSARKVKAPRPVHFMEERYFRPMQLAMDLEKNPTEAVQLIDSGALDQWLTRSLDDKQVTQRYELAIEGAQDQGRGAGYAEKLLCRVSVALDPDAPLRYAGMKIHPEGFPVALHAAFVDKKNLQDFVELINNNTVMFWLNNQTDMRIDVGGLISRFDGCRSFLRQAQMGYGIERCLYFLCVEGQCLSDKLKNYYVLTPEELMYAFEDLSGRPERPELFIDRHVAAFLSVKDRRMIDPFMQELNAAEMFKRVMGNIKTLATIQKRSQMEMFPGITRWIADILPPVYERLHDREMREKLRRKMEKLKEVGDISRIAVILDNPEMVQRDIHAFRQAMQEYHELREEYATLEHKMRKKDTYGRDTGREVAAIVSCMLAGILMLAFTFLFFTGGGPF
jgi:hypothetical protein